MINFVIATHGELGAYLVETAEMIIGEKAEGIEIISISPRISADEVQRQLEKLLERIHTSDGTVIFTDIMGGTPTNIAAAATEKLTKTAIITGVNLSMMLSAYNYRYKLPFKELVVKITSDGKKSMREIKALLSKVKKKKHKKVI